MTSAPAKTIEELLATYGRLTYTARGTSMLPLIREGRDIFVLERPAGRLHKYDVALYRRGAQYVLHRVVGVLDVGYLIRGDNCWDMERVNEGQVIGVMTALVRDGRELRADGWALRLYARVWCATFCVRACARMLVHGARRMRRLARPHGA